MNQLLDLLSSIVVPFVTGAVLVFYAIIGYQQTRMRAFAYVGWACGLGVIGSFVLHLSGAYADPPAHPALSLFWSCGYIVSALLGTYGMVLLIRHVLATTRNPIPSA